MKYSDAQKEATARYNKKTYDRINVIVRKGQRQIIKDFAASQGSSNGNGNQEAEDDFEVDFGELGG